MLLKMSLKMYSFVLFGVVAFGELADVVTGVVNLYVTGAGFVSGVGDFSSSVVLGRLMDFRSVTDEYGCKLRNGLVLLGLLLDYGPGVVDTFLACFFFFLFSLLWLLHGLSIDCLVSCVMWLSVGSPHSVAGWWCAGFFAGLYCIVRRVGGLGG